MGGYVMDDRNKALAVEQNDISFSKANDYFIYSRFTEKGLSLINGEQFRYAENIFDAVLYVHHILLYDILNDLLDDMQYDFKTPLSRKQLDIIVVMNFGLSLERLTSKVKSKFCNYATILIISLPKMMTYNTKFIL